MVTLINFDFSKSLNLSSQKPQNFSIFYNQKKIKKKNLNPYYKSHTLTDLPLPPVQPFVFQTKRLFLVSTYKRWVPYCIGQKKMNKQKRKSKTHNHETKHTHTHTQRKQTVYKISTRRLQPHFCVDIRWLKKETHLYHLGRLVMNWNENVTNKNTQTHKCTLTIEKEQ